MSNINFNNKEVRAFCIAAALMAPVIYGKVQEGDEPTKLQRNVSENSQIISKILAYTAYALPFLVVGSCVYDYKMSRNAGINSVKNAKTRE